MSTLYHPLNEADDEIRLLTLLPKSRTTGIPHCTLDTCSLKAFNPQYRNFLSASRRANSSTRRTTSQWIRGRIDPELAGLAPLQRLHSKQPPPSQYRFMWGDYAALSYVWGNEKDTSIIVLNKRRRRVTTNLAKALSAFIKDGEFEDDFKLWVDAICINQQDLDERARQLRKMRQIYGSAWAVVAWLGEPSFQSDSAFQLIHDFSALSESDCGRQIEACLRSEPEYLGKGCWLALHDLMERPYWYRLWIIQEMIMGASATWIRCGSSSIDWTSFCSGIAFLEEICGSDKVYGLVGLMSPAVASSLKPDYTLPVHQVYAETARAFILAEDSLDPIRDGNPWGPSKGPSWAADWLWEGRVRSSRTENQLWGPTRFFPRLGPDTSFHTPYRASGDTRHDASFSSDGSVLTCSGFIVDSISGLSARGIDYFDLDETSIVQPNRWVSAYGDRSATSEALFRTLVMDRVAGGAKATARHAAILHLPRTFDQGEQEFSRRGWTWLAGQSAYYFRWETFHEVNSSFKLGDDRLHDFFSDTIPDEASEFDYSEVYSCYDRTAQRRRFMTTANGYMGWAPDNIYGLESEQTISGDLIAVLYGCSTPIVIRPHGHQFRVIGEAYVQGLMDGEAMDLVNSGKLERVSLEFR
ncbi:heterokaryon incompatibility protein or allele [Fusarium langsethiae]|uniref:Heterokaryon incompatibility protein or allele n=1 Tax=Fusarium langsethiae TaxID=179993 RepID=A0A0N0DCJ7_FUSLA|nr:heterokaryon incompatibility protein or allele [Fusarium langsethiae]GKU06402.1 unnamed protein product [Fusarium langsethiae]GKU21791.1 unnamed protein product [Fusarium langsethiae]